MIPASIRPRQIFAVVAIFLILSIVSPSSDALAARKAGPGNAVNPATPAETGKVTVALRPGQLNEGEVAALLAAHGLKLDRWLPELGLARASIQTSRGGTGATAAAAAVSELDQDSQVEYATQERLSVEVADIPGDEYWSEQWGPARVGLPASRDLTWGDPGVVIAIVDTGVNYFHWDLRGQLWMNPGESEIDPATGQRTCNSGIAKNGQDDDDNGYTDDCRGYDFDTGTNDPADAYGHGTVVAGIAGAATNNPGHYASGKLEGIAGMGGAARIMALRAMNANGVGSPFNIAEAIRYAADNGAKVVNLSLTLSVLYNPDDAATLCKATDYAQSKGSLVVGASGNHSKDGIQPVSYPAACPGVLAVGASTQTDARAVFSDAGSRLDLLAPGEGIYSTLKTTNTSYGRWGNTGNGTSFAAPHAAGAAALLRSLRPDLTALQVMDLLRNSADDIGDPGFDNVTGWGRLNIGRAAAHALDGLSLRVLADPPGAAVSGTTQVRIQVTGPDGAPAGLGARINLVSALGVVSPTIATADGTGVARATFRAGTNTGAGSVTASLGPISATTPVTVSSGLPAAIRLASDPPILPTSGRATVTASVLDDGGNPTSNPVDVTFSATLGTVDPLTARTAGGKATTTFNAGAASGTARIEASAAGFVASLEVPVLGAGEPFTVTLDARPQTAVAGGLGVEVAATVVDASGKVVPDGTVVDFTSDLGSLLAPTAATKAGKASTQLDPGTIAGIAHISGKTGLVEGRTTVTIEPGAPASLAIHAEPKELVADYNQLATITAVARDQYGNVAADGVLIQFSTTLGQLVAASAPMHGGRSQVQLIGGLVAGTAEVTAAAPGGAHASAMVVVKPNVPNQMSLVGQPVQLTVGGGASRLRATIKDAYGNLVSSGIPVTFTTDLGQVQPAGGGTGGPSYVTFTNAGIAEADLAPGTVAGIARVHATVAPELSQIVQVAVKPAGTAQLQLSAEPMLVAPGGRVDIAAHVVDSFGNAVANGTTVTFGVNRGQLYQSVVPTAEGYAATWFTAPAGTGPLQVVAVSGGVSATPLTVQVARPAYLPLLTR